MTTHHLYGHYGKALHPRELNDWAELCAGSFIEMFTGPRANQYPILCYRGMSGVATATALAGALVRKKYEYFGQIYVRKPHETSESNGIPMEGMVEATSKEPMLVFCDDFIGGAATFNYVISNILAKFPDYAPTPNKVLLALHDESPHIYTLEEFGKSDPWHKTKVQRCKKVWEKK